MKFFWALMLFMLALGGCEQTVGGYLQTHSVPPEVAAAMQSDRPSVGMPRDALSVIGRLRSQERSPANEVALFYPRGTGKQEENAYTAYVVTISKGGVIDVQYPLHRDQICGE